MSDITTVPTGTPIALLPVRLETRFVPGLTTDPDGNPIPDPGTDLIVRIYPDQVHADAHEPTLTEAENAARTQFIADGGFGADTSAPSVVAAWARLVQQYGPARAAWIARQLP